MGKNIKFDIKATNKTNSAFNAVKGNLGTLSKGLALIGGAAVVGGLYATAKGLSAVTKAAMGQRAAESTLGAVLKSTGEAAGYNLEQLKGMASGLQEVTTYGDETILTGMSVLATFKNIRGEAFERTTKAALDMSTVMKTDLKSSMLMLGKAINDPVTQLSALTRTGVTFTEEQKEMIKGMAEAGDVMGAQALILDELESEFGGAAEAAGGPFDKALKQLKNTFGDLLEAVGFAITDNEVLIEVLGRGKEWIRSLIPVVGNLVKKFFEWLPPAEDIIITLNYMWQWVTAVAKRFLEWIGPIDRLRTRLSRFLDTVKTMLKPLKLLWDLMHAVGTAIGTGAAIVVNTVESFQTGTGPAGLPADGLYYGHKGEIVSNKTESDRIRKSGGANINITIAPMFMTGDRSSMRIAAQELYRELNALGVRWGTV